MRMCSLGIATRPNLEQVAAHLGHTSLGTTRIDTTPTEQDLVKAVETLED